MTREEHNRATAIIEQIEKLKSLEKRIQKDYNFHCKGTDDKHLAETLELCTQAVSVLIEIDEEKLKQI